MAVSREREREVGVRVSCLLDGNFLVVVVGVVHVKLCIRRV